ncbi:hypothetical protein WMY93_024702 [Mugilogobius chulae]|uniref:Ig-like domain-containing protein n=1 Tax=Mugilogobius chulae TaxID=88201 RepID=A0AAW0N4U4_9GOBI
MRGGSESGEQQQQQWDWFDSRRRGGSVLRGGGSGGAGARGGAADADAERAWALLERTEERGLRAELSGPSAAAEIPGVRRRRRRRPAAVRSCSAGMMSCWLVLLILLLVPGGGASPQCPQSCRCYSLTVECGSTSLRETPKHIPPSTQTIFLQDNRIAHIRRQDLSLLRHLHYLYLQNNSISAVEPGSFEHQAQLLELALNGNRIHLLTADLFQGLEHLRILYLSRNDITRLQDYTFRGLQVTPPTNTNTTIHTTHTTHAQQQHQHTHTTIARLQDYTFRGLQVTPPTSTNTTHTTHNNNTNTNTHIQHLNPHNDITRLQDYTFRGLQAAGLHLQRTAGNTTHQHHHPPSTHQHHHHPHSPPTQQHTTNSHNDITRLQDYTFRGLQQCTKRHVTDELPTQSAHSWATSREVPAVDVEPNIQHPTCRPCVRVVQERPPRSKRWSYGFRTEHCFDHNPLSCYVELKDNNELSDSQAHGPRYEAHLQCGVVPSSVWCLVVRCVLLMVRVLGFGLDCAKRFRALFFVPKHGVHCRNRLQELHLQQNSIELLSDQALSGLSSLALLDLSRNNLHTMGPTSLQPLVSLQVLRMTDNPWRCDCALHWLRSWIDEEGQRLLSSAERRLVCADPPRLSQLSLVEVPLNSLVCIPPVVQLEPRRLAVRLGESLRVSCHASGYPRPQVTWRKASQGKVALSPRGLVQEPGAGVVGRAEGPSEGPSETVHRAERFDPDTGSGMLFLSNVTVAHAGFYECEAWNAGGVARVTFQLAINSSTSMWASWSQLSSYAPPWPRLRSHGSEVSREPIYALGSMAFSALGPATQTAIAVGISLLALTALLLLMMIYSRQQQSDKEPDNSETKEESILYVNDYSDGPTTFAQLEEYRDERGHEMYVLNRAKPVPPPVVPPDVSSAPASESSAHCPPSSPPAEPKLPDDTRTLRRMAGEGGEAEPVMTAESEGIYLNHSGLFLDSQIAYEIHC